MKNLLLLPLILICVSASSQNKRKVSAYLSFQVDNTIYDRTISNNGSGFGGSLQIFFNTKTKFKPSLELTSDAFGGTKQLFVTSDGKAIEAKDNVSNILAGASYYATRNVSLNVAAGASFFNSHAYFAVKPTITALSDNQRFQFKISLTQVFQRDEISNKSFGYLNFGVGMRLF